MLMAQRTRLRTKGANRFAKLQRLRDCPAMSEARV